LAIGNREEGNVGKLGFNVESQHAYTSIPPQQLGTSIGLL
jgi:hypothetical protein